MSTDGFADMRTASVIAAYGQLRHNHVLLAGQSYDEGGCEIPDGFVEPAPQVLDALIAYADRGVSLMAALGGGAEDKTKVRAYYTRTAKILRVLRAIVGEELANRPLSVEAKRFLAAVSEIIPASSDSPPLHTGWYFQLFRGAGEALESAGFMADYYTSTNTGLVAYAGAIDPDMGIFVVDTSGPPRMFVGPVAHAFETHAPLAKRLADDEIPRAKDRSEPWSRGT